MRLRAFPFLAAFLVSSQTMAAGHPKIESVTGSKTALLQQNLELRDAAVGDEILAGERIRTDEKTTVVISYPDGSHLTVNPNSDLEIESVKNKIQGNLLRSGQVSGAVNKVPIVPTLKPSAVTPPEKPKIHFVIRTRTAVMGVRGTEFVAACNAATGNSAFHTLEGTVDVATNPTALLSGEGTPVSAGQFIQATDSGLGAVQPYTAGSFFKGLYSGPSSSASNNGKVVSSSSSGEAKNSANSAQAPPASAAPLARLPDPAGRPPSVVQEEEKQKKEEELEKEKSAIHLLSFSVGAMMSPTPLVFSDTGIYRAVSAAWTPSIPMPVLKFLMIRGSFGGSFAQGGSLSNGFLIREYQAFLACTLLRPLYVEIGGGEQVWSNPSVDAGVYSLNAGIILSENGRLSRIFVGTSTFQTGPKPIQIHSGIGLQW